MVLHVGLAGQERRPSAAAVEEQLGLAEVLRPAALAGQLDQRQLDRRVAVGALTAVRADDTSHVAGRPVEAGDPAAALDLLVLLVPAGAPHGRQAFGPESPSLEPRRPDRDRPQPRVRTAARVDD